MPEGIATNLDERSTAVNHLYRNRTPRDFVVHVQLSWDGHAQPTLGQNGPGGQVSLADVDGRISGTMDLSQCNGHLWVLNFGVGRGVDFVHVLPNTSLAH